MEPPAATNRPIRPLQYRKSLASQGKINKTTDMMRFLSLFGALLMSYLPSLMACEGCKEPSNVAGDSGVAGISASFSWSVVFMLGMLAFLLTGMVLMMIRSCKQLAEQQHQVSEASRFRLSPLRAGQAVQIRRLRLALAGTPLQCPLFNPSVHRLEACATLLPSNVIACMLSRHSSAYADLARAFGHTSATEPFTPSGLRLGRLTSRSSLGRLHRCQRDGVDDVIDQCAA